MSRVVGLSVLVVLAGCGSGGGVAAGADRNPNVVEGDDARRDLRRVEDMLRGQVAGVTVEQTPAGLVIRIRGGSSGASVSGQDPLFVIDGLPVAPGPGGALAGLNPRDVRRIEVLKNASETAMYGSRGANGVVLISTKK